MPAYHLTFDIDWAPDWSVRESLAELDRAGVKATFFATHDSPVLDEIRANGHTLGIHPNFHSESSHGDTPVEIVAHLLEICPDAEALRTHGLFQSSRHFHEVATAFPQLKYDLSTLTLDFAHVAWFDWHLDGARLKRINYTWEDDVVFGTDFDWELHTPRSDLAIYDFHPIHVSLNSRDATAYSALKGHADASPLHTAPEDLARGHTTEGAGTRTFLRSILASDSTPLSFEELLCA